MVKKKAKKTLQDLGKGLKKSAQQMSPGKVADTAAQQLKGKKKRNLQKRRRKPSVEKGASKKQKSKRATEGLLGLQQVDQQQLQEMRKKDALRRKKGLRDTREDLARLLIRKQKKYEEIQEEIKKAEEERERKERGGDELPAYQRGKPGAPETVQEKKKRIKEMREKEEEKKKEVKPPSSGKSDAPGLKGRVKKKKTKAETRQWNKG